MKEKIAVWVVASLVSIFFIGCDHKTAEITQVELPFADVQKQVVDLRTLPGNNNATTTATTEGGENIIPPAPEPPAPEDDDTASEPAVGSEGSPAAEESPPVGDVSEETPPESSEEVPPTTDTGAVTTEPPVQPQVTTRAVTTPPQAATVRPLECEAARGFIKKNNRCVCDGYRGFVTPPSGYPAEDSSGNQRCLQRIEGVRLTMQAGPFSYDGTDSPENLEFLLCRNSINPNDSTYGSNCFRRTLSSGLNLATGAKDTATFTGGELENKFYPDDAQYFYIVSNGSNSDRLLLAGVSLKVKLIGESHYKYAYRNGCVWRYIEKEGGHNWYAPFSREHDDAWCFFFNTPGTNGATNADISAEIPLSAELPRETDRWLDSNWSSQATNIYRSHYSRQLIAEFSLGPVDDFGHNGDGDTFAMGAKTLYGFTVYNGHHRTEDRYRIRIFGNDAWHPSQIRVLHFIPGESDFANAQSPRCSLDVVYPNIWFSSDPYVDVGSRAIWPNNRDTQSLHTNDCNIFEEGFTEIGDPTIRTYLNLR